MCKARDWQQVRTAACLFCFLLCVLLNVHLHSAAAAGAVTAQSDSANLLRTNQSRRHLNLIMLEYGGLNKSVGLHGLERLMMQIGLMTNETGVEHKDEHDHEHGDDHDHDEHEYAENANRTDEKQCPSATQMLAWYPTGLARKSLTESDFLDLCPTLVYLLYSKSCSSGGAGIGSEATDSAKSAPGRTWKVWGASLLAVLITSLGGMATIFLIRPLMRTRFYTLVVQFLIALAVGSLSGDAFLHLLPHALFPDDDHDHEHKEGAGKRDHMGTLYRCLTALIGIYCFFVIERITVLCQNRRSRRRSGARRPQSNSSNVGEKLCNPFHRSYANLTGGTQPESVICEAAAAAAAEAAEAAADELTVEFLHDCNRCTANAAAASAAAAAASDNNGNNGVACFRRLSACSSPGEKQQQQQNNHHNVLHHNDHEKPKDSTVAIVSAAPESELDTNLSSAMSTTAATAATDTAAVGSRGPASVGVTFEDEVNGDDAEDSEGRGGGHGHHHHHGHSHSHTTVRALAWTVIIGDGLHNFCDGMALGAAFAADVGSGVSTAVAVFCHELPHELGDFAVLLQAGMSVRMALLANLVSSLVCLLGMICGVLLAKGATNWVFMVTAGMFLYIALVDMMPELTTEKSSRGPGPCVVFFWQNLGFFIGAGIMLLISLFEHKLISFGSGF